MSGRRAWIFATYLFCQTQPARRTWMETGTGSGTVKPPSVGPEGRQDVGIAVELRTLLCHQLAIFLSPLQPNPQEFLKHAVSSRVDCVELIVSWLLETL